MNLKLKILNLSESYRRSNSMTNKDIGMRWIKDMLIKRLPITNTTKTAFGHKWDQIRIDKSQNMTMSIFITNLISAQSKQIILYTRTLRDINQIRTLWIRLSTPRFQVTKRWDQCQISWKEMVTLKIWKWLRWPINGSRWLLLRKEYKRKKSLRMNGRDKSKKRRIEKELTTYSFETVIEKRRRIRLNTLERENIKAKIVYLNID